MNLTAGAAKVLVIVEALPQSQQRARTRLGSGVDEDGDFGVKNAAKGIKEPSMRVNLLSVLLLEAENHLRGREILGVLGIRRGSNQLLVGRHRELTCKLEDVGDRLVAIDILAEHAVLVNTDGGQDIEHVLVGLVDAVKDEADDNLLPSRPAVGPKLGFLQVDNVADVLHDAVQRARQQHLVFVVVGDGDEQLRVAVVHARAQIVAVLQGKVVGVARGGRVAHLGKLLAEALDVAVLRLHGVLDGARHGVVDAEDGALHELDATRVGPLQPAGTQRRLLQLLAEGPALLRVAHDRVRTSSVRRCRVVKGVAVVVAAEAAVGTEAVVGAAAVEASRLIRNVVGGGHALVGSAAAAAIVVLDEIR